MVLDRVRQLYPQLTKSQRKLADYTVMHHRQAAFMTAAELGVELGVNEATVIRFAQRLGYRGYPDLLADLQSALRRELSAGEASITDSGPDSDFCAVLLQENEQLRVTIANLPPEAAQGALESLARARRIHILGQGLAAHLGGLLECGLQRLGYDARLSPGDPQRISLSLAEVESGDVVVGISTNESDEAIANALRFAKQAGAQTVALGSAPLSALSQAAQWAIPCPGDQPSAASSVTVVAALIDALVQTLAQSRTAEAQAVRARAEQAQQALAQQRES